MTLSQVWNSDWEKRLKYNLDIVFCLPPFSLIRDFGKQIFASLACYWQIGSKSTNYSHKCDLLTFSPSCHRAVIGGFRSDLSDIFLHRSIYWRKHELKGIHQVIPSAFASAIWPWIILVNGQIPKHKLSHCLAALSPPQKIGWLNFFRMLWELRQNVMISKQTFHLCNLPFFQLEPNVCCGLKFPHNFRNKGIQLLVCHVDFKLLARFDWQAPVKF